MRIRMGLRGENDATLGLPRLITGATQMVGMLAPHFKWVMESPRVRNAIILNGLLLATTRGHVSQPTAARVRPLLVETTAAWLQGRKAKGA